MPTYNRSLVFIFGAVAYHLDDKVKPIDINFVHFLFIHRIDEEIEEPQLNFFNFNPKNCLEPSLHRVFVHIERENIIFTISRYIRQSVEAPEDVVKVFLAKMLLKAIELTHLIAADDHNILVHVIVFLCLDILIEVHP